ncbi:hypothetical protein Rrhod_4467 [Rhodococcus rhodnii LMG 5362]|uniref:Uncharacterized protein n=1 Tax=Rhodococcus rhodnii LMG 5362 TaxID=1273125 RepID=R7WGY2_9NOCA|nr:hypothetical protein Rrhod_4467 [Rhodococcus rhodnii LMG 5362]
MTRGSGELLRRRTGSRTHPSPSTPELHSILQNRCALCIFGSAL